MAPDDRFADLGTGTRAGDRLADLDRREPERRPEPPRRRGRYSWVVGVAFVIAIVVVLINSAGNPNRGNDGPPAGKPAPRFAAPLALGPLDGDVNINQSASDPAPGNTPACDVNLPGALRSCDYTSKPLVLTFAAPTGDAEAFVDRVERLRARFPRVNFVTVLTAAKKDKAAAVVRDHRWRQPVVFDRNGNLITLYRVSFPPTVVFVYAGGVVRGTKTTAAKLTDAQLAAAIRATERRR
jgi:3-deoxy-D-manno-octulosonic-acid transferase